MTYLLLCLIHHRAKVGNPSEMNMKDQDLTHVKQSGWLIWLIIDCYLERTDINIHLCLEIKIKPRDFRTVNATCSGKFMNLRMLVITVFFLTQDFHG